MLSFLRVLRTRAIAHNYSKAHIQSIQVIVVDLAHVCTAFHDCLENIKMPLKLLRNIVDEDMDRVIDEGQEGNTTFESAYDCNAAAAMALYMWLGHNNCSEWKYEGVAAGTFEMMNRVLSCTHTAKPVY